ncbi:MAG: caspase family protein [Saprospiraceae bacterium]
MTFNKYHLLIFFFLSLHLFSWAQTPELVLPTIQTSSISELTLSPDGRLAASCAYTSVSIWETASGRLIRSIQTGELVKAAFSPDNKILITGNFRRMFDDPYNVITKVRLWDCETGKEIKTLQVFGLNAETNNIEFNKSGDHFLAAIDSFTYIWNYPDCKLVKKKLWGIGHFSTDGQQVFLEMDHGSTELASISNKEKSGDSSLPDDVPPPTDMNLVRPPTDDQTWNYYSDRMYTENEILTISQFGSVQHWDIEQRKETSRFSVDITGHGELSFEYGKFSNDGKRIGVYASANTDFIQDFEKEPFGCFFICDAETGKQLSNTPLYDLSYDGPTDNFGPDDFWGMFTPDLKNFIMIPRTQEGDSRAGIQVLYVATGKIICDFGMKKLEGTVFKYERHWKEGYPKAGVYNGGEFIMVDFGYDTYSLFYPETGKLLTCNGSLPTDFASIPDNKWQLSLQNGLVYDIKEKASGKTKARLLFSDDVFEGNTFTEALNNPLNTSWAVTTPDGLFDASPDMMSKLHYVVGMETIGLGQLKARYHAPGLLPILLGYSKGEIKNVEDLQLNDLYPQINASIENGFLNIELTERKGGLGALRLAINGKTVLEDANPERKTSLSLDLKPYDKFCVPEGNTISLVAGNRDGWLESGSYELKYMPLSFSRGSTSTSATNTSISNSRNASLYVLCVGTSKYQGDVKTLVYPDMDAAAIASALEAVGKGLFTKTVQVKLLSTADNTPPESISSKKNIEAAFNSFAALAKPEDVIIVYFAGHGKSYSNGDESLFYYLTKDVTDPDLKDPVVRKTAAVSTSELTQWLTSIPALKQVLIFDACNSGKAAELLSGKLSRDLDPSQIRALDRMKDRTGMFILSGSAANQLSYEASEFGQGLLTYSLLEGISGAALSSDNTVDVMTLFQHARDKVPVLARQIREIQVPVMAFPVGGGSFEIGLKKPGVKIPLAQKKPVFIRSEFQDDDMIKDRLDLGTALGQKFSALSSRGAQAPLVYIDTKSFDNGYAVFGRYIISGDGSIKVNCRLFKQETLVKKFDVEGKNDDVPGLAGAIMNEALKAVNNK